MTDLSFNILVGGTPLPFIKFSLTGGAYGSVGHVSISTSNTALLDAGIDLFALTSGSPGLVEVTIEVQQAALIQPTAGGYSGGGMSTPASSTIRIFGGEYLRTDWDLDADTVTVHARDWAGVLVDQKRILTKIGAAVQAVLGPLAPGRVSISGISNENQKIGDIVTSIATEFGFSPVLNLSSSGRNPTVGTLYGSADQSFITVPQSLWTILNQLARDTGYDVYVTPKRELVFGEPGVGLDTLQLCWNTTPGQGQLPCKHTRIEHHPRRNSTFRVLVISYDPCNAQATLGRATYVGAAFAGQNGLAAGLSTGQGAVTADQSILGMQRGVNTSTLTAAEALPLVAQYETGNRNILNQMGPGGTPASTASGYYQIINGTWAQFAAKVPGASQYRTAISAPKDVQTAVATAIYEQQGIGPWSSNAKLMAAISSGGGGANIGTNRIPLYAFNLDGLDQAQATLKAESIATDIAKRELILSTTIDGLPSVLPTQKIRLSGDLAAAFSEPTYYISGFSQEFSLPSGHSHKSDTGWITRITALNIATEGLAKAEEG